MRLCLSSSRLSDMHSVLRVKKNQHFPFFYTLHYSHICILERNYLKKKKLKLYVTSESFGYYHLTPITIDLFHACSIELLIVIFIADRESACCISIGRCGGELLSRIILSACALFHPAIHTLQRPVGRDCDPATRAIYIFRRAFDR